MNSTRISVPVTGELEAYLDQYACREPRSLAECRAEAQTRGAMSVMQIAPEQGSLLTLLAKLIGATKVLELGTFTGYSTAALALGLSDDGSVLTCDLTDEYLPVAQKCWQAAGVQGRIQFTQLPAAQYLDELADSGHKGSFDLIFIDADKPSYSLYFEKALELVRPGGLILLDDTLSRGYVVGEPPAEASPAFLEAVATIQTLNRAIATDKRVEACLLPAWDGLTIVRKHEPR